MISIYMVTTNAFESGALQRTVDSVLSQDYQDFEFIICDDAGSDGTAEYLSQLAARDKRIRVIRNEVKLSNMAVSLGRCMQASSSAAPYVTWIFDDNIMLPATLNKLANALDQDNNIDFVFGKTTYYFDKNNSLVVGQHSIDYVKKHIAQMPGLVPYSGILLRREMVEKHGWLDANILLRRTCCWDLLHRYIQNGSIFNIINDSLFEKQNVLESDVLQNISITDLQLIEKYITCRDDNHWGCALENTLYDPPDRIPPGAWNEQELHLVRLAFLEYYMLVENVERAFAWALLVSEHIEGIPENILAIKNSLSNDVYHDATKRGIFIGYIGGYAAKHEKVSIKSLKLGHKPMRYRVVDAIKQRLKHFPTFHRRLYQMLMRSRRV